MNSLFADLNRKYSVGSYDGYYQGSNAEYLVLKQDGGHVSNQEYKERIHPILNLQFPRTQETESKLTLSELEALDRNEVEYIDLELAKEGFKAVKIPKTLYDLLYVAFRCDIALKKALLEDITQAAKDLEIYIRPRAATIAHYSLKSCQTAILTAKVIHEEFSKTKMKETLSEVDFEVNAFAVNFLQKSSLLQDEAYRWDSIHKIYCLTTDFLKSFKPENHEIFNSLYRGDGYGSRHQFSCHSIYRLFRSLNNQRCQTAIVNAIYCEFVENSQIYTLYRGGKPEKDDCYLTLDGKVSARSISFGQGLFSSSESDAGGAGSVPLEYIYQGYEGYAVRLNKEDYRKGKTGDLMIVPPAQRSCRFRLEGEFTHARFKVYHDSAIHQDGIAGMENTPHQKVPYILTSGPFGNAEEFRSRMQEYLQNHAMLIT